jgi:hypothetical protein
MIGPFRGPCTTARGNCCAASSVDGAAGGCGADNSDRVDQPAEDRRSRDDVAAAVLNMTSCAVMRTGA